MATRSFDTTRTHPALIDLPAVAERLGVMSAGSSPSAASRS